MLDNFGRVAASDTVGGNALCDHRIASNYRAFSNRDALENRGPLADPNIVLDNNGRFGRPFPSPQRPVEAARSRHPETLPGISWVVVIVIDVNAVADNVATITETGGEFESEVMLEYQKTLDLGTAMRRGNELNRIKKEREARKAAEEAAERARREAQEAHEAAVAQAQREQAERYAQMKQEEDAAKRAEALLNAEKLPDVSEKHEKEEQLQVLDFRVYVTNEQKLKLRDWLNANGIRFCRVPKFGD